MTGASPPPTMRLPDGSEQPVKIWRDIMEHATSWLWKNRLLTTADVPVASSSRRFILNTAQTHPGGNLFKHPISVSGTPLFLEGNVNVQAVISNTRKLLGHVGQNPDAVWLKVN